MKKCLWKTRLGHSLSCGGDGSLLHKLLCNIFHVNPPFIFKCNCCSDRSASRTWWSILGNGWKEILSNAHLELKTLGNHIRSRRARPSDSSKTPGDCNACLTSLSSGESLSIGRERDAVSRSPAEHKQCPRAVCVFVLATYSVTTYSIY